MHFLDLFFLIKFFFFMMIILQISYIMGKLAGIQFNCNFNLVKCHKFDAEHVICISVAYAKLQNVS